MEMYDFCSHTILHCFVLACIFYHSICYNRVYISICRFKRSFLFSYRDSVSTCIEQDKEGGIFGYRDYLYLMGADKPIEVYDFNKDSLMMQMTCMNYNNRDFFIVFESVYF